MKENNMFISNGTKLSQKEVDELVRFLLESGLKLEDIQKLGKYNNWFRYEENQKSQEDGKKNL